MTVEIVIFVAVVVGVAAGLLLERMRGRIEAAPASGGGMLRLMGPDTGTAGSARSRGVPAVTVPGRPPVLAESAARLRAVSDARFQSLRLLSEAEVEMRGRVERIVADLDGGWRVMAQVPLAGIVAASDAAAAAAIADQRVELLIVASDQLPLAVVEYQPLGQVRDDDAVRDAVKREALRRAGIGYFEVRAGDAPELLAADLAGIARRAAPAPVSAIPAPPASVRKPRAKPAARPVAKPGS